MLGKVWKHLALNPTQRVLGNTSCKVHWVAVKELRLSYHNGYT